MTPSPPPQIIPGLTFSEGAGVGRSHFRAAPVYKATTGVLSCLRGHHWSPVPPQQPGPVIDEDFWSPGRVIEQQGNQEKLLKQDGHNLFIANSKVKRCTVQRNSKSAAMELLASPSHRLPPPSSSSILLLLSPQVKQNRERERIKPRGGKGGARRARGTHQRPERGVRGQNWPCPAQLGGFGTFTAAFLSHPPTSVLQHPTHACTHLTACDPQCSTELKPHNTPVR